jgi:cation:H+ antiporter
MLIDIGTLLGGGLLLYLGAEWFVAGAAGIALALRIPQLIVGLTVVAYGTSAPEIIVGVQASLSGHGGVALGNVLGSNIANLGLILGTTVLVRPARVDAALPRRELPVLALCTVGVPLLLWDARIARWEGALLVGAAIAYTAYMVRSTRGNREAVTEATAGAAHLAEAADAAGAPQPSPTRRRLVLTALAGLALLLGGGHLFVMGATAVAVAWGMSERLVGLTIVAIGTSLPELITSLIAASRGHSDIAVGNVIGSNIFNVLLCLGVASLAGDLAAEAGSLVVDLGALVVITLAGAVFIRSARTMERWEGAVLVALYLAFMTYLIVSV